MVITLLLVVTPHKVITPNRVHIPLNQGTLFRVVVIPHRATTLSHSNKCTGEPHNWLAGAHTLANNSSNSWPACSHTAALMFVVFWHLKAVATGSPGPTPGWEMLLTIGRCFYQDVSFP